MSSDCWVLVPFKGLEGAKSRWTLTESQRKSLALELLDHCLSKISQVVSKSATVLVTPDSETAKKFSQVRHLAVPGQGLNSDLELARTALGGLGRESSLLVILPDLPELLAGEVQRLVSLSQQVEVVLCPDQQQRGTNALALSPPLCLDFDFEGPSFGRFVKQTQGRNLSWETLTLPGLAFDCDSPSDLRRVLAP